MYQFKDTRLLTELMALYSVMCSVSGSLSSIAQKIQNEIVDVLMAFTRPVLQTTDTEEAINNSVWLLMLKELLQCTMSRPQFFLGGLSLLSELLPIPLPINTLEVREIEEKQLGPNHIDVAVRLLALTFVDIHFSIFSNYSYLFKDLFAEINILKLDKFVEKQ